MTRRRYADGTRDDLATWRRLREQVPWRRLVPYATGPVTGRRDGAVEHVRATAARDPARAERLLSALSQVSEAVDRGSPLTFDLLATWQATVLGTPRVGFRRHPAYAKNGRERYGLDDATPTHFAACLAEAVDPAVPLAARVARVYLDVCFFHPFDDGNARAALLTAQYVLLREDVRLDQVAPMAIVTRRADDPDGAADLARLVLALMAAAGRRRARPPGDGVCRSG